MAGIHLILGGARSGKSRFAEQDVTKVTKISGSPAVYIATATVGDDEMKSRIDHHIASRESDSVEWITLEEPTRLGRAILSQIEQPVVLVDCLTLWLSNCLQKKCWPQEREAFFNALEAWELSGNHGRLIFVSNETGLGVVPMGQLSREFVDQSGFLHQEIAGRADQVTLVVAGLPMQLKP